MRLLNDDQLLDSKFRAKVLEYLASSSNQDRKREMKKRAEVYKDLTVKWVIQKLKDEGLKAKTLKLMTNRAANVSICRKIVNKLARSYTQPPIRDTGSSDLNDQLKEFYELLSFDDAQIKADRYLRLFKNCLPMTLPEMCYDEYGDLKYNLKQKVFSPSEFDVLESAYDKSQAACIILSDYSEKSLNGLPVQGSTQLSAEQSKESGPEQTFIWWNKKYHFTTDEKGRILTEISPEDLLNPISMIPGQSYAADQDSGYWSTGGDDLVDGSILINTLITDVNALAFIQGWGQIVITGKKIPQEIQGGPHNALVFTYEDADPEPKVQVVNANPPLDSWMKLIEQQVALTLSTNDLSPASISMKLDANNFPSGIAMLIERSEATNSIQETQTMFARGEKVQFEAAKRWQNHFMETGELEEEFAEIGAFPDEMEFSVKFPSPTQVVSEKEKLENLKLRKDLGLNTEIELLKIDNPDITDEAAIKKLAEIKGKQVEAAANEATQLLDQTNEDRNA